MNNKGITIETGSVISVGKRRHARIIVTDDLGNPCFNLTKAVNQFCDKCKKESKKDDFELCDKCIRVLYKVHNIKYKEWKSKS